MTDMPLDVAKYINQQTADVFADIKMYPDPSPNIFAHEMPNSPDFAVSVMQYAGRPPTQTFGNPLLIRHPRAQVMIRKKYSEEALKLGDDILRLLAQVKDQVINGTEYARIEPVGEPFEIGPDSSNRQRVTVNLEVSYYDTI